MCWYTSEYVCAYSTVLIALVVLYSENASVKFFTGELVTSSEVSTMDVFQEFYAKLVEVLPMNDLCFIASLVVHQILSVDVKFQVQLFSLSTQAEKASYLLDNVIWPSVNSGSDDMLYELLKVMKDSRYNQVRELTTLIRFGLNNKARNSETG